MHGNYKDQIQDNNYLQAKRERERGNGLRKKHFKCT